MVRPEYTEQPTILGLCNPLLDITAYVDEAFLEKHKLKANDAILAGEEQKHLCQDLRKNYKVEYTAGGSAQNVMRVVARIYSSQKINAKVIFSGCIGNDEFGQVMTDSARADNVTTAYSVSDKVPTGTCAVCLTENGKNRSLCAFLGASQEFSDQHLLENWSDLVECARMIYITGFLIAVSPKTFHLLGKHIAESANSSRRFCVNLAAPYVSSVFGSRVDEIFEFVDILFGNDDELLAYAKHKGIESKDVDEIARQLALAPKARPQVGRLVIVTQGERPVVVAEALPGNQEIRMSHFEVPEVSPADIVDTNGAGDAFAGGFVSQYAIGQALSKCVAMGNLAAQHTIRVSGTSLPDSVTFPEPRRLSEDGEAS